MVSLLMKSLELNPFGDYPSESSPIHKITVFFADKTRKTRKDLANAWRRGPHNYNQKKVKDMLQHKERNINRKTGGRKVENARARKDRKQNES
jgi:hypothetical protein